MLKILQKFYVYNEGNISVNGVELNNVSFENWRTKIGVVPQEIKLFSGTLIDNILLGKSENNLTKLESFFEYYGFDSYFKSFPSGYSTILGEGGINISGGQKQLIGLARALYHQPELLFLDEPTAALDRDAELFVLNILSKIKNSIGIIFLTHKLKTAKKADRIYIIEKGRISQEGSHCELLNSENIYSKNWQDLLAN